MEALSTQPARDLRRVETQALATGRATAPPKPSSFLAATTGELDSAIKNLAELNERLSGLANVVFGALPETDGVCVSNGQGIGVAADIESRVNAIHLLIAAAHRTAIRLEAL